MSLDFQRESIIRVNMADDTAQFNEREMRIIARAVEEAGKGIDARVVRIDPEGLPVDMRKIAQTLHKCGINVSETFDRDANNIVRFKPQKYEVESEKKPKTSDVSYSDIFESIFGVDPKRKK